jgi:hypothetical protein
MTVGVVGRQWYWVYEYPNLAADPDELEPLAVEANLRDPSDSRWVAWGLRLLDSTPLRLPVAAGVEFLTTAEDVIHSFALPAAGIKMDAVPGRLNQVLSTFLSVAVVYGQCSELCGSGHGFMPITAQVGSIGALALYLLEEQNLLSAYLDAFRGSPVVAALAEETPYPPKENPFPAVLSEEAFRAFSECAERGKGLDCDGLRLVRDRLASQEAYFRERYFRPEFRWSQVGGSPEELNAEALRSIADAWQALHVAKEQLETLVDGANRPALKKAYDAALRDLIVEEGRRRQELLSDAFLPSEEQLQLLYTCWMETILRLRELDAVRLIFCENAGALPPPVEAVVVPETPPTSGDSAEAIAMLASTRRRRGGRKMLGLGSLGLLSVVEQSTPVGFLERLLPAYLLLTTLTLVYCVG